MRHLGRYRLDTRVGSGAFGTVWRAYDPDLDAVVALKVLADNWVEHAGVCERFMAEARLLRRIASPAVVRVHDVGTGTDDDGTVRPYFVMDFVGGGTLADRVGRVPVSEALQLAADAARAVQVLHDEGAVHRDVKPGNLLVDPERTTQRVVVADLGSAKLLAEASTLTVVTGSPSYMAPEQARGAAGGIDARADVYAVGVVAYELLTGRRPYDVASPAAAGERADLPPPAVADGLGLAAQPGADLDAVLACALQKRPELRFASCAALAEALDAVAAGGPVTLPDAGRRTGDPEAMSRRTWPVAGVAVVAVLALVVAAVVSALLAVG